VLNGVYAGQTVCVALKARDEAGNWSALSNSPCVTIAADTIAPAAVTDLTASNPTVSSLDLRWTAQGEDGNQGAAALTDLRFLDAPLSEANWAQAQAASGELAPPPRAGTREFLRVSGLNPGTPYYFALKTRDEAGNWSALSNVATGTTPAVRSFFVNFQDPLGEPTQNPLIVNGHVYQKAGVEAYAAGRGYGWDYTQGSADCQPQMMTAYETNGSGVNVLQRSILYNDYGRRCYWQYDLPSGTYTVAVGIGWPGRTYGDHQHVDAEGVALADASGLTGNAIFTGTVPVADGQLTLAMGWTSNGDYTMLNYIDVLGPTLGDTAGPAVLNLRVNGQSPEATLPRGTASAALNATLSDRLLGNQAVTAAEYFVDVDPGAGNGTPLIADDGAFDEPEEPAHATTATAGWLPGGVHAVYVRGRDAGGRWTAAPHVIYARVQDYSLAWGKAASSALAPVGRPVTFTLTLYNRSAALVSGIRITDVVPLQLSVLGATASAGTPVVAGQQVTWQGSLAANTPLYIWIRAQGASPGAATNTGQAGYGEGVLAAAASVLVPGQWVYLPLMVR
jgi:uncharacterized repeat protein (TIGR01451 family)